jgi:FtsP/CotA-like multicopper oxidase with cupredoxin domain
VGSFLFHTYYTVHANADSTVLIQNTHIPNVTVCVSSLHARIKLFHCVTACGGELFKSSQDAPAGRWVRWSGRRASSVTVPLHPHLHIERIVLANRSTR